MPKLNKCKKQSLDAIKKHWEQVESFKEILLLPCNKLSDAEPDIIDESQFNTFWVEGEETCFNSDKVMQSLQALQQNMLKELVENAKGSHAWAKKSRGPIYKGSA